ncbi:hypothetical protein [Roseivirga misakiensis]|uniref:hypothetical protein n=1 Tax=Roseivirga misakiensis TaxID=1563681 RepID=UPI00159F1996|nr:hypothetical protein [Roseivirga misakiensis]
MARSNFNIDSNHGYRQKYMEIGGGLKNRQLSLTSVTDEIDIPNSKSQTSRTLKKN